MLGRDGAISLRDALSLLMERITCVLPVEKVSLIDSYGRVLSEDIIADQDLPGFNRSSVDGYALNSQDTFGAGKGAPCYLTVIGEVLMGEMPALAVKRGEAVKIPTGGMLPEGADSVLMLEHAEPIGEDMIEALRQLAPGENVIAKDEDVRAGEHLFSSGTRLSPADVALLAGLGIKEASVYKKPQIAIISTGNEIVPHETPLRVGLVRDTNSFVLAGLVRNLGAVPIRCGIIQDEFSALKKALFDSLKDADMVLISGGSSVGTRDIVAHVVGEFGSILFHGVLMKPGKPALAGFVSGKPVFGLPGHPVSAVQCFDTFVRPALEKLSGLKSPSRPCTVTASLAKAVRSQAGRHDFVRVMLNEKDGALWAVPVLGKSGLLSVLLRADGVVEIPPERLGLEAGEQVTVRLLRQSINF